jgi:hypothetical protein
MGERNPDRSQLLAFAALGYSVITFAIIGGAISSATGKPSLPFGMLLITLPLSAICAMALARLFVRFHLAAMAAFVCWIIGTVWLQCQLFAQALWSM